MTHKGWHSRGHLPHFDSAEATQFVTFRLIDSLPRTAVETRSNLPDALDGDRHRLLAWSIRPNHVHVVVEPIDGHSLRTIVQSWKPFTAKEANRCLSRSGPSWHHDYLDRHMRNEHHLATTISHVENNPVKAGLVPTPDA